MNWENKAINTINAETLTNLRFADDAIARYGRTSGTNYSINVSKSKVMTNIGEKSKAKTGTNSWKQSKNWCTLDQTIALENTRKTKKNRVMNLQNSRLVLGT